MAISHRILDLGWWRMRVGMDIVGHPSPGAPNDYGLCLPQENNSHSAGRYSGASQCSP